MADISTTEEETSHLSTSHNLQSELSPHSQPAGTTTSSLTTITSLAPTKPSHISPPTTFPHFPLLPIEIRLRIWAFTANATPRTLDIWTTYTQCTRGNATFYTQKYNCHLASKSPHPVLQATQESREEGLKHFTLEYETVFPNPDFPVVNPARFYVNYAVDTLVPRGYWNICAFRDFMRRGWGRLRRLAADVRGSFWKDNLRKCVTEGEWTFEGLEELVLYDVSGGGLFGEGDHFDVFKKRWDGEGRGLRFVEMGENKGGKLDVAANLLKGYLRKMNGEVEEGVEGTVESKEEDARVVDSRNKSEFFTAEDGIDGDELLPRIRIMRLVVDFHHILGSTEIDEWSLQTQQASVESFASSFNDATDPLTARIIQSMDVPPRSSR